MIPEVNIEIIVPSPEETHWPSEGIVSNSVLSNKNLAVSSKVKIILAEFVRGVIRGTLIGLTLKAGLNALLAFLKSKPLKQVASEAFSSDTFKFTKFIGLFLGLFRGFNATFALQSNKDCKNNAAKAGALASVALLLDSKDRRQGIALYLFVRSLDVTIKRLVREGKLPFVKHFEAAMFGLANIPIMYGFLYEPDILSKSYYKWILGMGNVPEFGIQYTFRDVRNARINDGVILPFRPCQPHYHEGPCHEYIAKDYVSGLFRAAKIYLPVHLLPLIIFKSRKLMTSGPTEAMGILGHALKGFISSCFFLSSYVLCCKCTVCTGRNLLHQDHASFGVIAGLLTSFATVFERQSRVSELMIYCWPRSLEGAYQFLYKRGLMIHIPYWEVPLFAIAMSFLMSSVRADFKPTFHSLLTKLVGGTIPSRPKLKTEKGLKSTAIDAKPVQALKVE